MPQIGDSDGGSLLPLAPRGPDDAGGLFGLAAVFFGRSDYAWGAGSLAPEALWLFGPAATQAWAVLQPAPPPEAQLRHFDAGGYVVMRSGWDAKAHHLIFDVGPLGGGRSGAHGHADLLSIQCSAFGEPYLVDPGTFCYAVDARWRSYFRGTSAHSTVSVDDEEQAVPVHPFRWQSLPRARLRRCLATATDDCADAEHEAYARLRDPAIHRRRVLFARRRYWVIVDDLEGCAMHSVTVRFQFAPLRVDLGPDSWARAHGAGGGSLLIRAFAAVPLEAELRHGTLDPIQGWISPDYGWRRPAPALVYTARARLPLRIATLLLPEESASSRPPAVRPLISRGGPLVGLALGNGRGVVRIDQDEVAVMET